MRLMLINNEAVRTWCRHYSDFSYSLYACAQNKLQDDQEILREFMSEDDARSRTIGILPPLKNLED